MDVSPASQAECHSSYGTAASTPAWRKASYSGAAHCVEITVTTDTSRWPHKADSEKLYLMRDAKNPDGPILAFTPEEWEAFTLGVKDGEFDLPEAP
jgi:hypothetical protein